MATMGAAFGLALLAARKRRRWRQEDLAEAAGLDRGYVSRIETGTVEPGLTVQERLAAALGIPLAELVADAEKERERFRQPAATEARPTIAAAIIVQDSRVLMTRRRFAEGSLVWGFPTGAVEDGESPEQAARREVLEEVGLKVKVVRRLGERVHPATGRHMIYLACRVVSGTADLVDHEELAELAWCDLAQLAERVPAGVFEPVQKYLDRALIPAP